MSWIYILILFILFGVSTKTEVLRVIEDQTMLNSYFLKHPFDEFPRYENITDYLERIASNYHKIVSVEDIGVTFEERTIYAVKISSGGENKPIILIDAGMNGHEWMAPTVAIYAIHQLLKNKTNKYLYQNVDWYIIPCLNPDGYEYTFTSHHRWWRKNRSKNAESPCIGTDINRNFNIGWMGKSRESNPCSDFYRGFAPFSESESKALRNLFRSHKGLIKIYLTLHSFGMNFLYPWRWTKISTNNINLRLVARKAARAITKRYNTQYFYRSTSYLENEAGGSSDDWMFAVGNGVDLSYAIELPGHTYQMYKLPIEAIGLETFDAFKVFHSYIENKYKTNNRGR